MTLATPGTLQVRELGRIDYAEAMQLQDQLVEQRLNDAIADTLLLLEHPPTITLGRRATLEDVYLSEAQLQEQGIALQRATRGGLVTYHGPGQLVGYPIVKLRARGLSVPCYVRALELSLIDVLNEYGVHAFVDESNVGVFTDRGKIGAIGVAVRHGVTLHGFAVNLQPDLSHFALINPCGIAEKGVTSVKAFTGNDTELKEFERQIAPALERRLNEIGCETTPTAR